MKNLKYIILILVLATTSACTYRGFQKKGSVETPEFYYSSGFTTMKSLLLIPVEIDGETRNFLFDTGAGATVVQREVLKGNTTKVGGASNRKMTFGKEYVASMKIGKVNFKNTFAWNGDLEGLKEQIPNFGGLIGQPIIAKANWLINYPDSILTISNKHLADDGFQSITINRSGGAPYVDIMILGKKYEAIIDLGSSSGLSVPEDSKLAKVIVSNIELVESKKEIYTIGGLKMTKKKEGVLPLVKLGKLDFTDVPVNVKHTSQIRLGNVFFNKHVLYIDNINKDYKIKMK